MTPATAIALMGPTASGKTRLAIRLAQALNGEIISVDSALVYRGMDIGTAKPTQDEREGIPHHLIDILDPAETYSTGLFRTQAVNLMAEIQHRGRIPILAGGTMLYFNSLFHGLSVLPPANPTVRQTIEEDAQARGWGALHAELALIDPRSAARIHPNDPQRLQRALEVYRMTGKPLSEWHDAARATPLPTPFLKLVLSPADRASLHRRIHTRFLRMIELGLIEEVQALRLRGDLHADLPSMRAVGYRQVLGYLEGLYGREDMIERGVTATRQFAKRQMTWLRRETDAIACAVDRDGWMDEVLNRVRARLERMD